MKVMRLNTGEFIRRFLTHVLPDGLHRIRYYGFLASAKRKANIAKIRAMIGDAPKPVEPESLDPDQPLTLRQPCPECGGQMRIIDIFRRGQRPMTRAPPRSEAA